MKLVHAFTVACALLCSVRPALAQSEKPVNITTIYEYQTSVPWSSEPAKNAPCGDFYSTTDGNFRGNLCNDQTRERTGSFLIKTESNEYLPSVGGLEVTPSNFPDITKEEFYEESEKSIYVKGYRYALKKETEKPSHTLLRTPENSTVSEEILTFDDSMVWGTLYRGEGDVIYSMISLKTSEYPEGQLALYQYLPEKGGSVIQKFPIGSRGGATIYNIWDNNVWFQGFARTAPFPTTFDGDYIVARATFMTDTPEITPLYADYESYFFGTHAVLSDGAIYAGYFTGRGGDSYEIDRFLSFGSAKDTIPVSGGYGPYAKVKRSSKGVGLFHEGNFFPGASLYLNLVRPKPLPQKVTGFTLVDPQTGKALSGYENIKGKKEIALSKLPTKRISVKAVVNNVTTGSVVFSFKNKKRFKIDSEAPYTLFREDNGTFKAWRARKGTYQITATPYSKHCGLGQAGTSESISLVFVR